MNWSRKIQPGRYLLLTRQFRTNKCQHASTTAAGSESNKNSKYEFKGTSSGPDASSSWRRTMNSWEIHSYSGPKELQLNTSARVPTIKCPQEILVKVKAASVNPIDVAMSKGYGSEVISSVRKLERGKLPQPFKPTIDFPITLGRDFAGTVVEKGSGVRDVHVGDEVYGVLGFTEHGSHAEYTVARGDLVRKKPQNLTFAEAASIPYVALTCWSALKVTGNYFDFHNKRFLVLGGSGGVGTFAVQYLIANGAKVVTTCSTDAIPQLESYLQGYGIAVDYTQPEVLTLLQSHAPYDCILNVSGPRNDISLYLQLLKPVSGQYITLSPPLLNNFDQHGFLGGAIRNALEILKENVDSLSNNRVVTKWGFFMPSSCGLKEIGGLVDQGQIRPVVEKTFKFSDLPLAYERIEAGHLRGKVVVEF